MNVKKSLTADGIILGLKSTTKPEVIEEMLDHLVATGRIKQSRRDQVLEELNARERKMSTGMQYGVAIPHCKSSAVDEMVAAIAISPEGIDFNSLDGERSRIFVMTVSPIDKTGPHIQFLAEISRLLNDRSVQEKLLSASSVGEVLQIL